MKLYGKNPVLERLKADPGSVKKLYLQKRTDLSEIVRKLKELDLKFDSVEGEDIEKLCPGLHTQGVVAEVDEFEYASFSSILFDCVGGKTVPVFIDGVTDPQNLGGIVRNLACLGGFSLVIPEHNSAVVNSTVLRVANGGENYLDIATVPNIATALKKVREEGVCVAGALLEDSENIREVEWKYPLAVVIGSEGKGIRPGVQKELDLKVALPMAGAKLSYNAAVAAALVCYEITRSKQT